MKQPRSATLARMQEAVFYKIKIAGWSYPYSFGIADDPKDDPNNELRHLHLKGTLLDPGHIKSKLVQVTLLPRTWLNASERDREKPTSVGKIWVQPGLFEVVLSLPAESLAPLLTTIAAEGVRSLSLEGTKLHLRQCDVRYYRFEKAGEEDAESGSGGT